MHLRNGLTTEPRVDVKFKEDECKILSIAPDTQYTVNVSHITINKVSASRKSLSKLLTKLTTLIQMVKTNFV